MSQTNTDYAWSKTYSASSLYTMADVMENNSNAIQGYIEDLTALTAHVTQQGEAWSNAGVQQLEADTSAIKNDVGTSSQQQAQMSSDTATFNKDNSVNQANQQFFSSMSSALNTTSSNETQTQTQDIQNIQQGPMALMQMLLQNNMVIA